MAAPLSLFLIILFIVTVNPSISTTTPPSELVNNVCKKTSNYSFCVLSLSADPRTPSADSYGLSFISFGMAYLNASNTQDFIGELMKNAKRDELVRLRRCHGDYEKGVSALEVAYNDLNSESFYELANLAGVAAHSAKDCQSAFMKIPSPLISRNRDLKALCEICVAVSKLFNVD
ncbi:hypothetical protein UlMin_012142 [Ulmus minor]